TPGSAPPWSSVTFPTSSPKVWPVCAAAGARPNANTIASAARARRIALLTGDLLKRGTIADRCVERYTFFIKSLGEKVSRKQHRRNGDGDLDWGADWSPISSRFRRRCA